jgi:hypothetical protein
LIRGRNDENILDELRPADSINGSTKNGHTSQLRRQATLGADRRGVQIGL